MDNQRILTKNQLEVLLFNRKDRLGGYVEQDTNTRLKLDLWPQKKTYRVLNLDDHGQVNFVGGGTYYPHNSILRARIERRSLTHQKVEIELTTQELRPLSYLGRDAIVASRPWGFVQCQNGDVEFWRYVIGVAMQGQWQGEFSAE